MPPIKDNAIVLRRLDYSETSQVLFFLTREHGPVRLMAKGIKRGTKKKFATGIDLLERGEVVFSRHSGNGDGGLGTLTEWRQADLYLGLRKDIRRLWAAQYAAEITSAMTEESDPHPELFDALQRLLEELEQTDQPLIPLVNYQCDLLKSAGLWPDLTRCVTCNKPAPPGRAGYFSAQHGGLICRDCEINLVEKRKASAATLTGLRERTWDEDSAKRGFNLLDYTLTYLMGRPTQLAKFILPAAERRMM